jgi:hypothetical protein
MAGMPCAAHPADGRHAVGIAAHDHIIVGKEGRAGLKGLRLI